MAAWFDRHQQARTLYDCHPQSPKCGGHHMMTALREMSRASRRTLNCRFRAIGLFGPFTIVVYVLIGLDAYAAPSNSPADTAVLVQTVRLGNEQLGQTLGTGSQTLT